MAGRAPRAGVLPFDSCKGLQTIDDQNQVVALMATNTKELRQVKFHQDNLDATLLFISDYGKVLKSYSISMNGNNLIAASMGLIFVDNHLYMAAKSYGFQTNFQDKANDSQDGDTFVYRFELPDDYLDRQPQSN